MLSLYNRLRQELVHLVSELKNVEPSVLSTKSDFLQLGFDLKDVGDVIRAVEKKYDIVISGDLPVFSLDDFVTIVQQLSRRLAIK